MAGKSNTSFSTLFWNIWVRSQLHPVKLGLLKARFDEIITKHKPDVIGLNEVLADKTTGQAPILAHLESLGYHTYFVPFSPERTGELNGSALACRHEVKNIQFLELGPDKSAARRGEPGHTIKLILASIPHAGQTVNIVVNHLAHLVPYNWSTHVVHHKAFRRIVSEAELQATTIIGGDFNQLKFMPRLWKAKETYNRATGTFLNPTWKLLGKVPVIQANYDNIFWTKCGQLELVEFKILKRRPSDHAPLLAQFTVPENA
ncbi:MAG TPA: endonuclease/exonuclease/phosphatase family protein [Candidatus Saccharimonadales bacterium]|nr:endonuclease/exonuclease/phosphatase family protein [Candidatus Saccharimonadales bacterium]